MIFDVSFGRVDFHDSGGPYQKISGENVSCALVKLDLDMKVISNISEDDLTEKEVQTMKGWKPSFKPIVSIPFSDVYPLFNKPPPSHHTPTLSEPIHEAYSTETGI